MSFTWFADKPLRTQAQVAQEVYQVAKDMGLDDFAAQLALMCIDVEAEAKDSKGQSQWWCPWNSAQGTSNSYPYDSQSNDGRSVGYFQQQCGPNGEPWWGTTASMMTLASAARQFLTRLPANYRAAKGNADAAGEIVANIQQCAPAYRYRYALSYDYADSVLRAALGSPAPTPPQEAPVPNRPDFNEFPMWSPNNQGRNGTKIDLFLLHTQEGDGNAASLAGFLGNPANEVSYHYTISTGYPNDNGVTVVDVVRPDAAAWSVGNANNRSINLCFAGSSVNWSRNDWLTRAGRAIDVAAYIAVRDCQKYGISTRVVPPPYNTGTPGISDHKYVTQVLKWGTHTDVGPNFPWDVFAAAVAKYADSAAPGTPPLPEPPVTPPAPSKAFPKDYSDRELLEYIAAQLGPGDPSWASKGSTLRDKVWSQN